MKRWLVFAACGGLLLQLAGLGASHSALAQMPAQKPAQKPAVPKVAAPKAAAPKVAAPKTAAPKTAAPKPAAPNQASDKVAGESSTDAKIDTSELPVTVERAFGERKFKRPIVLTHAGDGSGRVFVASQLGEIQVLTSNADDAEASTFIDLTPKVVYKDNENEEGLLGLTFHPKYKDNGQFFVCYTTTSAPHTTVVSRFRVSKDDPNQADPEFEEELLRVPQPFWNHNGGTIIFGADGYLYIALGDGGKANDPWMNGQNLNSLMGKILRIDVDGDTPKDPENDNSVALPYRIPKDNPFVGYPGLAAPEVWAYGLRNVWRMAFDRETGLLWAADVGQNLWEEIDIIVKGGNYGWNLREGKHKFGPGGSEERPDLIEPIWEYHHDVGKSITGGLVYRGKQVPALVGLYLYADYVTGRLWALGYDVEAKRVVANHLIRGNTLPVMSFGEDEAGEAYFLIGSGTVHRFKQK